MASPHPLSTQASSLTRALDEVGDKWCLLIIQEVFWGINTFGGMLEATGVSRGVLADRLRWLQQIGCLRKRNSATTGRSSYHLTRKSLDLHASAMMAIDWERRFHQTPELDELHLVHSACGQVFSPQMRCAGCHGEVHGSEVSYRDGPGARIDERSKKVRRRSSVSASAVPGRHSVYRNLINLVGDRWTANVIALAFHGNTRFDEFHRALPVATNILSERLRFLEQHQVLETAPYQHKPTRYDYRLTARGWALFPYFLTLLQWGDRWCDREGLGPPTLLTHTRCGEPLAGEVVCNQCHERLDPFSVSIRLPPAAGVANR